VPAVAPWPEIGSAAAEVDHAEMAQDIDPSSFVTGNRAVSADFQGPIHGRAERRAVGKRSYRAPRSDSSKKGDLDRFFFAVVAIGGREKREEDLVRAI